MKLANLPNISRKTFDWLGLALFTSTRSNSQVAAKPGYTRNNRHPKLSTPRFFGGEKEHTRVRDGLRVVYQPVFELAVMDQKKTTSLSLVFFDHEAA